MARKSFFREPGMEECWGDRRKVKVRSRHGLLEHILDEEEKAIHLLFEVTPVEFLREDRPGWSLLTKGNMASVHSTFLQGQRHPRDGVKDTLLKTGNDNIGYSYLGTNYFTRRVSFDSLILGTKLFVYSEQSTKIDIEGCYENTYRGVSRASIKVAVPSMESKHGRYRFRVDNVPIGFGFGVWNNIDGNCYCGYSQNVFSFKNNVKAVCAHEVAALYAIAKYYKEYNNKSVANNLPFFHFSNSLVKAWNRLRRVRKGPEKRHLSTAERSLMIGDCIRANGEEFLEADGKYIDYDW